MTDKSFSDLPYRPGVGIMMFNDQKRVFIARRLDILIDGWQMPQGGIDGSEEPAQAALRELKEETSVHDVKIIGETRSWYCYDFHQSLSLNPVLKKFRGQQQKWFVIHFRGPDDQINLKTDHPEFRDWKWTTIDKLPDLVVAFKRDLYNRVTQELWPLIENYSLTPKELT